MIISTAFLVAGGVYFVARKKTDAPTTPNTTQQTTKNSSATITYSDTGFSPSTLTVKSGDSVTVTNISSSELQMESDPHPAHTDNGDLNAGEIQSSQSKTFTVTKTGTFGYHNHLKPDAQGSITIK